MTTLSVRQRTMVNTALVFLHHNGVDAKAVSARASFLIREKVPPAAAYDQAVQAALNRRPELRRQLERDVAQVKASDDTTVAAYDRALSAFIASGDESALKPVESMAVRDAVQMGIRSGEISAVDVAAGRIDFSKLGMDGTAAAAAYAQAAPDAAPAAPQSDASTFSFALPGATGPKPGNPAAWTSTGGYSPGRATPQWQNAALVGDEAP